MAIRPAVPAGFLPGLPDHSQFTTQAANLWAIKQRLYQMLLLKLDYQPSGVHLIVGFPIQICHLTRASRSRVSKEAQRLGIVPQKITSTMVSRFIY